MEYGVPTWADRQQVMAVSRTLMDVCNPLEAPAVLAAVIGIVLSAMVENGAMTREAALKNIERLADRAKIEFERAMEDFGHGTRRT